MFVQYWTYDWSNYLPSTITEACQTTFSILCQVWVNNGPKTGKRKKKIKQGGKDKGI